MTGLGPGKKLQVIGGGRQSGDGPEDPMLEQRVGKLEEKADRIEAILTRLEPKITETLLNGAKQVDLTKLQLEVADIKASSAKQADLQKAQVELAEIKGGLSGLEGRLSGIEGRFSQIPTFWQMLGLIGTLLIGLAGLMFTAGKFLHP
jgi:hypothetical protein